MSAQQQQESLESMNTLGVTYEIASEIGDRLKKMREQIEASAAQLSQRVKIRERYIEAIEIGDWDLLPPGLNGRGLVRLYAKELGVLIPEFDKFKILTSNKEAEFPLPSQKKSKYQSSSEESAQIVRIIQRKDYLQHTNRRTSDWNEHPSLSEEVGTNHPPLPFERSYRAKVHTPWAIVTPKIEDILGISLESIQGTKAQPLVPLVEKRQPPLQKKSFIPPQNADGYQTPNLMGKIGAHNMENPIPKSMETIATHNIENPIPKSIPAMVGFSFFPPRRLLSISACCCAFILGGALLWWLPEKHSGIKIAESTALTEDEKRLDPAQPSAFLPTHPKIETDFLEGGAEGLPGLADLSSETKTAIPGFNPADIQTPLPPSPVERSASFEILKPVKLQLSADGKEVFLGIHDPGNLMIKFKEKLDFWVQDGSRVKMTYEGWEHGELGLSGRKRKITLHATPYQD